MCTASACICDCDHGPGEGEELIERLKVLAPRSIMPASEGQISTMTVLVWVGTAPCYAVELEVAHVSRIDLEGETCQWHVCEIQVSEGSHRLKIILPALGIDQVKVRHGYREQKASDG